jgi:CheY-like chemotaxis protein
MRASVLIVASPYDAQVLRRALLEAGLTVSAASGKEPAEELVAHQPDAIVLSHNLHGADSETVLRGIRRSSPRYLPVILICRATGEITTLAQAIRFGADHLILRPVEPELLLSKVESVLERERLSAEVELPRAVAAAEEAAKAPEARREDAAEEQQSAEKDAEGAAKEAAKAESDETERDKDEDEDEAAQLAEAVAEASEVERQALSGGELVSVHLRATLDDLATPEVGNGLSLRSTEVDLITEQLADTERIVLATSSTHSVDSASSIRSNLSTDLMGEKQALAALPKLPPAGHLQRSDFARLLRVIQLWGFAGALTIQRAQTRKVVFFDEGAPIYADSTLPFDGLGEFLVRQGLITRTQYERANSLAADGADGRSEGAILVDIGAIKLRELYPLVRRQVAEIIYSLFAWDHGEFELSSSGRPPDERIRIDARPEALVIEGIRRKYGLDRLLDRVGHPELRYQWRQEDRGQSDFGSFLDAEEKVAFAMMDGLHDLAAIERKSGLSRTRLYQLTYAAIVLDAVDLCAESPRTRSFEQTLSAEATIDRARVLAKHAQVLEGDYFALLGLPKDASAREVVVAHKQLMRRFDPAILPASLVEELSVQIAEIRYVLQEAHRVLTHEATCEAYRDAL